MIDKLAEKRVAGGLLPRVRGFVVVDKGARPGPQLGTDDSAQFGVEFDRSAQLARRLRPAGSRRPATADGAICSAGFVAEAMVGRSDHCAGSRRILNERRIAAMTGSDGCDTQQDLLEL